MNLGITDELKFRKKLFVDVTKGIKPERIPRLSNVWSWKTFDAGYNFNQTLSDFSLMEDAVDKFQKKYNFDAHFDIGGRNPMNVLRQFKSEVYHVSDDGEYINVVEKDMIDDPEGIKTLINKGYYKFAVEDALPKRYSFENEDDAIDRLANAAKALYDFGAFQGRVQKNLTENYGVPAFAWARYDLPMELIFSGGLRSIKTFSLDMRRNPDLLEKMMDTIINETEPDFASKLNTYPDDEYTIYPARVTLLAHTVMNSKQFDRFCWPYVLRYTNLVDSHDAIGVIMTEGKVGYKTDLFADLPKDRFILLLENDDPVEMKAALPNITIAGGYPSTLLANGSVSECVDEIKYLLDKMAYDGRWVYSQNKMLSFRNDCRAENLLAVSNYLDEISK